MVHVVEIVPTSQYISAARYATSRPAVFVTVLTRPESLKYGQTMHAYIYSICIIHLSPVILSEQGEEGVGSYKQVSKRCRAAADRSVAQGKHNTIQDHTYHFI